MSAKAKIIEAAKHYKAFCEVLGIDLSLPDTKDTPVRIARMMHDDFLVGKRKIPFHFTTFPAGEAEHNQLVNVCGIRMVSLCAHHHLPFIGLAHVCYLPNKLIAGLSKLPRLVQWIGRQPTMQETLTGSIVSELVKRLSPRFIGVRVIAEHTCMSARGVLEKESMTSTDKFWCDETEVGKQGRPLDMGDYETTKQEFFRAIDEWYKAKSFR